MNRQPVELAMEMTGEPNNQLFEASPPDRKLRSQTINKCLISDYQYAPFVQFGYSTQFTNITQYKLVDIFYTNKTELRKIQWIG